MSSAVRRIVSRGGKGEGDKGSPVAAPERQICYVRKEERQRACIAEVKLQMPSISRFASHAEI